ncbi:class A beta-lactamase-related serine hydrolase [Streptomycetaceae bacterium NBC_01309]
MIRIRPPRPRTRLSTVPLACLLGLVAVIAVLFMTPLGRVEDSSGDADTVAIVDESAAADAGSAGSSDAASDSPTATATGDPAPTTAAAASPPDTAAQATDDTGLDAALDTALAAALPDTWSGELSVAVIDTATGRTAEANGERTYVSASIAKVDILATLLLQAEQENRSLTAAEKASAAAMIRRSDNEAAFTLWRSVGGASALDAANAELGLVETTADADTWGLDTTTVGDQLRLMAALTSESSPLSAASRAYALGLMATVEADQAWGVSAAADEDADSAGTALKNGWLPRNTTGLWVVNSIGRITHDGRELLVAVLSDGHTSMAAGVSKVEAAVEAAAETLNSAAE